MAHTPGPWSVTAPVEGTVLYVGGPGHSIGEEVAVLYGCAAGDSKSDAAIIAAAPELYEALVMVRDADEDCKRDGLQTIPAPARARIDAAIAKAEAR